MKTSMYGAAALLTAASLLAACAQEADENPLASSEPDSGGPEDDGNDAGSADDRAQLDPIVPANDPNAVVEAALADVTDFWERTYPEVYGEEFPPISGRFYPYGPDTDVPPCGDPPPSYGAIANNAFYCPSDDLIAWDAATLIPQLNERFGPFTLGIVMAHEFGHAIQARTGLQGPTIQLELQADCFAGAWTRAVADGTGDSFEVGVDQLDQSVAGMVAISDAPGTAADDPMAHGSGFDRLGAFQDGFERGASRCAEYEDPDRLPPITEQPFSTERDLATGGNLPLTDLLAAVEPNLNQYWDAVLAREFGQDWSPLVIELAAPANGAITCGGEELSGTDLEFAALFCDDEATVVLDAVNLVQPLNDIGDFAVGAEVGRLFATAAQARLGADTEGKNASLQADCLTGMWAADTNSEMIARDFRLTLSPGDLDEGILGFLSYGDAARDEAGTVFERVDAMRDGFTIGLAACEDYGDLG